MPGLEMVEMAEEKTCQVCGKPVNESEMCFEKEYEGKTYYACCPVCFSILQKNPEKHIGE
jgi:YHS domain-containing protein